MATIAVVGSLNMDLVIRAPRHPKLGETIMGSSFGRTGGGKGSNQALACARLGARSYMIGCVGDDDFGVKLRSTLQEGKVDCTYLETSQAVSTGVAVITVSDNGENTIVLASGANAEVSPAMIERAGDVFKKADAVLFQLEISTEAVHAGLRAARTSGCKTVLTPAPARELPKEMWPLVDYLVLNETELAFYAGDSSGAAEKDDVLAAAQKLLGCGVGCVVVTRGAKGGMVVAKDRSFLYSSFNVDAVDSTGAGDSFCAALSVGITEGLALDEAVRFASAAGALACTRYGAHPSLPWRYDVEALLENSGGKR